ncbi:MAG: chorismate-binding protein, partial [Syntrophomonadaceae bacterium]|nr:chorismate-binding protein [Syntrophomonadaceae bacterium]
GKAFFMDGRAGIFPRQFNAAMRPGERGELEPEPRGPYAGALGYLSFQGNMDTAIIIRTMIREAGEVSFQVGAGIVADSDPEREYLETGSKARAMMNALRILEDDYGCLKRAI